MSADKDIGIWGRQCGKTATQTEWVREYFGQFFDGPARDQLRQLAEHCVQECEDFDATISPARNAYGIALLTTPEQYRESLRFLVGAHEDHFWIARQLGFTHEDWRAKYRAASERLDRWMRERAR